MHQSEEQSDLRKTGGLLIAEAEVIKLSVSSWPLASMMSSGLLVKVLGGDAELGALFSILILTTRLGVLVLTLFCQLLRHRPSTSTESTLALVQYKNYVGFRKIELSVRVFHITKYFIFRRL